MPIDEGVGVLVASEPLVSFLGGDDSGITAEIFVRRSAPTLFCQPKVEIVSKPVQSLNEVGVIVSVHQNRCSIPTAREPGGGVVGHVAEYNVCGVGCHP